MKANFFYAERIASFLAAVILLQTLFYKFSAHPDSIYIFSKLHLEPYGRIGIGIAELITGTLLCLRRTSLIGAILGFCTILGAIISHIFILGIVVNNDGGKLFLLALIVFISCLTSILLQWQEFKKLLSKINIKAHP